MNSQIIVSPPARVEPRHRDGSLPGPHADRVARQPISTSVGTTIDDGSAANEQPASTAPRIHSVAALEQAVWMVPDGDGWAEVYGDGDGWAVWDVETWAPAISYGGDWVVPDGDGWSPSGTRFE